MENKILWVNNSVENQVDFLEINKVGIGYSLIEDLTKISNNSKRLEKIRILSKENESELNRINKFFDTSYKYAAFHDRKNRKIIHLVKILEPKFIKPEKLSKNDSYYNKREFIYLEKFEFDYSARKGVWEVQKKELLNKISEYFDKSKSISQKVGNEELSTFEGKKIIVKHYKRERDLKFILALKNKFKDQIQSCKGCKENPGHKYRISAIEFLEAHHIYPLKYRVGIESTLTLEKDIAFLCPNCHTAIHKLIAERNTIITIEDFKKEYNL